MAEANISGASAAEPEKAPPVETKRHVQTRGQKINRNMTVDPGWQLDTSEDDKTTCCWV